MRGYQDTRTDSRHGQTLFTFRQEPETGRCSACGSSQVQTRGRVERRFRALPSGRRATLVVLPIPRVSCQACGLGRQVKVSCADPRRRDTAAFERYALERGRRMTIRDVAMHLGVSGDVIKEIQKRDLACRFARPQLNHLRPIAIDEIASAKGHRYLTVVMDLESGVVVCVGDGKGAKALKPFWKRVKGSGAKIAAVAMDMAPASREAVATNLPRAQIIFDRCHGLKRFNEKLADRRRALYRAAIDVLQKKVLKGTRWWLLKAAENLDAQRDARKKLEEALALNRSLATASYLKEDLRPCWEQPGQPFGTLCLDGRIRRAEATGIKMLPQMAQTLAAHRRGQLAYYDVMLTSGPVEGTKNTIETRKRPASGFRDKEFVTLKILAIHETRSELVG